MEEISRIIIEEYCISHNTAKSRRLQDLVEMSYDVSVEGTEVRIMGILDLCAIPVLIYSTVKR